MGRRKLLRRITAGAVNNVRFADFVDLVQAFGFGLQRSEGNHRIFWHGGIMEALNLQSQKGEAKPYQIRYFVRLVERYNPRLEE
jgi:hypothetical protein